jgi:hypothetical protein
VAATAPPAAAPAAIAMMIQTFAVNPKTGPAFTCEIDFDAVSPAYVAVT